MRVSEISSLEYPHCFPESQAGEVRELLEDFGLSHAVILREGSFLGAISRDTLEIHNDEMLQSLERYWEKFFVSEEAFVLDVLPMFNRYRTQMLPMLNAHYEFTGVLLLEDVLEELSKYPLLAHPGEYMVISTSVEQYSFSQISQIVERENVKVSGMFLSKLNDAEVEITLKISGEFINNAADALQRFGYHIVRRSKEDGREGLLKDRYEFMQKYLEL